MSSEDEGVLYDSVVVLGKKRNEAYPRGGEEEKKDMGLETKIAKGRVIVVKPAGEENIVNKFMGSSIQVAKL